MIHCAICFHDTGTMYKTVYCALLSCFENASEPIHVHALIDDSVKPNKHWLEELCASTGNSITFYENVDVPRDVVALFPNNVVGNYTEASLFRMCLHEQLPEEVEKVVYFDCDIIFERDVAELWNMELGKAWMIATHDSERVWSSRKKDYYLKALDIAEDRYFNSGVLVMNLKALREASREENVFWRAYRQGAKDFAKLKFPVFDQDLLTAEHDGFSNNLPAEVYYAGRKMNHQPSDQDRLSPEEKNWLRGMNFPYFAAEAIWVEFLEALGNALDVSDE